MTQPKVTSPVDFYLHNPAQSTSRYVEWAKARKNSPVIDYGCALDKYVIPLYPGDVAGLVARPGHGKSSLMAHFAKRTAQAITTRGEWADKCVIYVSWEQPIEELEAFFQSGETYTSTDLAWNRVPIKEIEKGAIKRVNLPVWLIGYSVMDADRKKPPLTIDLVMDTIRAIKYEYKRDVTLACFDYLQIIPVKGRAKRMEQVLEATIQVKHLAMELGLPALAGVQAKRGAGDMPGMDDCQWGSIIEQTVDKLFALFRPIKKMDAGDIIPVNGRDITVNDHLLIIKLLKQRLEKGWGAWPVHFEPEKLILRDYESLGAIRHRMESGNG